MVSRSPKPFHLPKDSTTESSAGSQTSASTRNSGIVTIVMTVNRSRPGSFFSLPWVGAVVCSWRGASSMCAMAQPKIEAACSWMLAVTPSMSSGFFRNSWIEGIITVLAKSALVSRSMNWAMLAAAPTTSADFFCRSL